MPAALRSVYERTNSSSAKMPQMLQKENLLQGAIFHQNRPKTKQKNPNQAKTHPESQTN